MPLELTVAELLAMYGRPYPRRRPADELIELVGLEGKRDARAGSLSGGQRRRLDLALALVGDPDLVFLDEPTTGFDPSARRGAWAAIRNLCALGKTVFLTTHFMDEAQALADRVGDPARRAGSWRRARRTSWAGAASCRPPCASWRRPARTCRRSPAPRCAPTART